MFVDVTVAVPDPSEVDTASVAKELPYGTVSVVAVKGGMSERNKSADIDEYIASASVEVRPILNKIRILISGKFPDAQETISYQLPAFKLGRTFIYFAAFKNHIGIFPPVKNDKN
jgi:Conserved hypothetical protein (Lin0512_fam)/Domain of unknown function (DUF5655)